MFLIMMSGLEQVSEMPDVQQHKQHQQHCQQLGPGPLEGVTWLLGIIEG